MDVLQTVLSLILTLGILVTVHEYGHFWVARKCGVKVLRFSVGFGRPLVSWKDRTGTEFAIAAIPLGGYVKMLDEREGEVASDELHLTFNRQPVGRRIAIAAAGPIANFLFAIAAYWLLFVSGFNVLAPIIGNVDAGSPAAVSGLVEKSEIVSVDGVQTPSWQSVALQLLNRIGDSGEVAVSYKEAGSDVVLSTQLSIDRWLSEVEAPDPIGSLGLHPYRPSAPAVIGVLSPDGAAQRDGLQVDDTILSVNGEAIAGWMDFVDRVRQSPEQALQLEVRRMEKSQIIQLLPGKKDESGQVVGYIGAGTKPVDWPENMIREVQAGPFEAVGMAMAKTWSDTHMTLVAIKKMVEGLISVKNLSGPITIARVASSSIDSGFEHFLRFLAFLSVSLGVLNLLPIPVLDGGHLLYYFAEAIRGKPLSEQAQVLGLRIGIALLMMLMFLAFYNDIARLF